MSVGPKNPGKKWFTYLSWVFLAAIVGAAGKYFFDRTIDGFQPSPSWNVELQYFQVDSGACGDSDKNIEVAWELSERGNLVSYFYEPPPGGGIHKGRVPINRSFSWNPSQDPVLRIEGWVCDKDGGTCTWRGTVEAKFQLIKGSITSEEATVIKPDVFSVQIYPKTKPCNLSLVLAINRPKK